ncbi:MAG TPA: glycosyltransferase [Nitrospira sp.]|jgi:glycosyltransferase involved in cell wall biosynthesis/SAM-dependent methyltransferase
MPAKIHYDVSDILEYARYHATLSGIQRVSTQLISHIVSKHGTERLRLIGWHPLRQRMVSFDASYFAGDYKYDQKDFCRHFALGRSTIGGASLRAYLKQKYGRRWRRHLHHVRLLLANSVTGGRTFKKRNIGPAQPQQPPGRMKDGFAPAPGDVVFIVGATWNFDKYLWALAQERRRSGIVICQFIHDLIPLLTPEHVVDDVPRHFAHWLKHLGGNTDYFLTNSRATKSDLDTWLAQNGIDVPTGVLPLAHQFVDYARGDASPERHSTEGPIHARIRNAARLPYALCVGSIESRKNIWALANVWKRIHARLGESTPRLIFAGNPGWLREDFDDFIKATGSLYGYIRILERPSDEELAYLYRRCLFSVFPSYKEGWGLPVGEGLWFGRPVVCSNTSAMPEVGGPLADYVDPTSWESIEAALLKMITDTGYREQRAAEIGAARLRTWSEVADDLWRELSVLTSRGDGTTEFLTTPKQAATPSNSDNLTDHPKFVAPAKRGAPEPCSPKGRGGERCVLPRDPRPTTQDEVDALPWWHSIDLGNGVVTKGGKTLQAIRTEAEVAFRYGVEGKTVLDIGAWNGAFSFEAERRGAAAVTALDHHIWTTDPEHRKAFELARDALGSSVKDIICDVHDVTPSIGEFDVVLLMGIFHHLKNPLLAMEIVGPLAREMLILESYTALNDLKVPAMRFFPRHELDGDASNWWGPNIPCLRATLELIGFRKIQPTLHPTANNRVIMHAWR